MGATTEEERGVKKKCTRSLNSLQTISTRCLQHSREERLTAGQIFEILQKKQAWQIKINMPTPTPGHGGSGIGGRGGIGGMIRLFWAGLTVRLFWAGLTVTTKDDTTLLGRSNAESSPRKRSPMHSLQAWPQRKEQHRPQRREQ